MKGNDADVSFFLHESNDNVKEIKVIIELANRFFCVFAEFYSSDCGILGKTIC